MINQFIKIVLLSITITICINAQSLTSYGIKLGLAFSNPIWKVGNTSINGIESMQGADIGLFADWSITHSLFITSELHFIQKGLKTQFSNEISISNSERPNVNYLSIPLTIKYHLIDSEIKPYLIGGPRIDFAISKNDQVWSRIVYQNVKDYDFGLRLGIGVQTKSLLGIGTGLEVSYSPSFVKVDNSEFGEITNRSFELNIIFYK